MFVFPSNSRRVANVSHRKAARRLGIICHRYLYRGEKETEEKYEREASYREGRSVTENSTEKKKEEKEYFEGDVVTPSAFVASFLFHRYAQGFSFFFRCTHLSSPCNRRSTISDATILPRHRCVQTFLANYENFKDLTGAMLVDFSFDVLKQLWLPLLSSPCSRRLANFYIFHRWNFPREIKREYRDPSWKARRPLVPIQTAFVLLSSTQAHRCVHNSQNEERRKYMITVIVTGIRKLSEWTKREAIAFINISVHEF